MIAKHIDNSLDKIRTIFELTSSHIEALKPGEKIPATQLAAMIATKFDMKGPELYFTLKFLFNDYPGVVIRRGAQGGIFKLAAAVPAPVAPEASSEVAISSEMNDSDAPVELAEAVLNVTQA